MSYKFEYSLNKIEEISQLIIDKIKTVKTIMLRGELGSGKTTLVKSVLKRMGVNDSVTSPTFSILNEYDFAENPKSRPHPEIRRSLAPRGSRFPSQNLFDI